MNRTKTLILSLATLLLFTVSGLAEPMTPMEQSNQANSVSIGTIDSSGFNKNNNHAKTTDNDRRTGWSSQGESWIQFDLMYPKSISHAAIAFYKGKDRAYTFNIAVSDDGETWTTSDDMNSRKASTLLPYALPKLSGQFVRINVKGNDVNDWSSITEVAILGRETLGMPIVSTKSVDNPGFDVESLQSPDKPVMSTRDAGLGLAPPEEVVTFTVPRGTKEVIIIVE